MSTGRVNIDEILKRYFDGAATKSEVKMAEDYMMMHPEAMESFIDKFSLRLEPQDKEYFLEDLLYKSVSDLSEEQAMLLVAAAAEGDLPPEEVDILDESLSSGSPVAVSVSDFKNLKLKPFKEGFRHKNRLLKVSPGTIAIRRGMFYVVSAAAVIALFIITAPLSKKTTDNFKASTYIAATSAKQSSVTGAPAQITVVKTSPVTAISRKENTRPSVIEAKNDTETPVAKTEALTTIDLPETQSLLPSLAWSGDARPVVVYANAIAGADIRDSQFEDNWLVKGVTGAVGKISTLRKSKSTFDIADKGIKEINKLLGWNMQLEKVVAANGETEVISFRSDLVGFSKPVKKKQ